MRLLFKDKAKAKQIHPSVKIPLGRALFYILALTLLISGPAAAAFIYMKNLKEQRANDDKYRIVAIVQSCSEQESLKTVYLAELLNLSVDRPINLYCFNSREAKKKLMECPLIKSAKVQKISPGTIYVDYILRKPAAYLLDYVNTAIDKEGVLFPFHPFFTPKMLPEIFLGLNDQELADAEMPHLFKIKDKSLDLAFTVLNILNAECLIDVTNIRRIDVSKALSTSCGQREIVVVLDDRIEVVKGGKSSSQTYSRYLRLSHDNYRQNLLNYLVLRKNLFEKNSEKQPMIVDFRIPHCALLSFNP